MAQGRDRRTGGPLSGFNALVHDRAGWWRPRLERVFVVGSRARRARERLRGSLARETVSADRLGGRFRLRTVEAFGTHWLVLPSSAETFCTHPAGRQTGVDRIDGIVALSYTHLRAHETR